jgi:hypothetical protein
MQEKKYARKYAYAFIALATVTTLATAVPVFAQTTTATTAPNGAAWGNRAGGGKNHGTMKPGVFGTVSAVNGNIITVSSTRRMGPKGTGSTTTTTTPTTTVYTVDATSATITKNNVAGTISSIVVGDTIMAQGTLTGTNLVATTIRDGVMARTPGAGGVNGQPGQNQTSPITGNGQPVVAGTVSSVSGNTLSITNKSNVSYTVDVTNAKIVEGQATITVSSIAVGDSVIVQGTVNGNAVTASSVIDQKASTTTTTGGTTTQPKGFFGSIGAFFSHLFGF